MEKIQPHNDPITYSARGKICGIYRPSSTNFLQGIFLTDDGLKIPAQLTDEVATKLNANRDLLKVAQIWKCYPRINPPWVMLVMLKSEAQTIQDLKRKGVNRFRIVGQVESVKDQEVTVLIKRNELLPTGKDSTFTLTLLGDLPSEAIRQFWRFNVRREGWIWTITSATFVAPSPEVLKQQLSQRKRVLSVRITEKEFQALVAYAEKHGKSQTKVVRALIRKLPTYETDR
ncbi:MAG TPA: hypothetical protein V6C90_04530 [Coleofasciculaceae cyanobacterium]|jgi:hypothetical protein